MQSIFLSMCMYLDHWHKYIAGKYLIFGLCFDANIVGGTQSNGIIQFKKDDAILSCKYQDMIPNFCGGTAY